MSEWISVEDRLPTTEDGMIVYADNLVAIAHIWLLTGQWLIADVRFGFGSRVTHWMLLPSPHSQDKANKEGDE